MLRNVFSFKNIFALFITLCFGYGVWEARGYEFLAKVFPFYISIFLLIFSIINLIQEIMASLHPSETNSISFSDLSTNWDIPIGLVWKRFFFYLALLVVLYVFIWVSGYPLTMMLFIFLFYRFLAKASWRTSVIAGLGGLAFLALTSRVLNMVWPEGLFRLPWPFG